MPADSEVAIVGGGPAGAALAIRLAAHGLAVTLFERHASPRWHASGVYSSPRTRGQLIDLGLTSDHVERLLTPISAMEIVTLDGARCVLDHVAPGACGLDRVRLERALLDRAAATGATIREGVVVRSVDLQRGVLETSGTTTDGIATRHRSRLIIGADGPRSMVARAAGVDRPVRALRRAGMTFHLADPWPRLPGVPIVARMVVGDGWYCGIAPVPMGRVNIGVVVGERMLRRTRPGHDGALLLVRSILGRLPGGLADWRHAPATDDLQVALPLAHRPRRRGGQGFLLVGDAAGFLDPLSGEGLHRALASADLAAEAILRWQRGDRGALGGYDHAMSVRSTGKDVLSGLLQLFLARPVVAGYAVRRLAARPDLRDTFGRVLADLERPSRVLDPRFLARLLLP